MNSVQDAMIELQIETILSLAVEWATAQETVILRSGVPLDASQLSDATRLGVLFPERVRLLRVEQIPAPDDHLLAAAAANLLSPLTGGMTLRYGIFIRSNHWGERLLVAHELVHTGQYERLGGFEGFLRPYLAECLTPPGYPYGPMEQEAIVRSGQLCN